MWYKVIAGHRRQFVTALLLFALASAAAARGPQHRHHNNKPSSDFVKGKICIGTNGRMSVPSNKEHHYRNLRDRFTNCTYVDGNLELTWLQNETWDLSFLQHIREVTGYVLISHVDVRRIVLPRLQIIRGRTLFTLNVRDEAFALMVTLCNAHSLEMPALRDILAGSVGIYNNYNLCHVKTINWDEIMTGPKAEYVYVFDFASNERECSSCDKSCEAGCWGEGPQNCQKFSKTNCSPQCYRGRCFGENPRDCCHLDCAGGCTGPHRNDCLACRNFYDDGVCTDVCPQLQRYNQATYSWEADPDGKYAYGATCVRNCPAHLLKDNGACVRSCPLKKTAINGECVPCDGTCPKTCTSTKDVHSGNIDTFKDCTIIDGSLEILEGTFAGFQQVYTNLTFGSRYQSMHPDRLEVFSTVKEITGYINIQAYHDDFTNLSYFRNLEVIGGRQLNEFSSLYIVKTSLKSLELKSLKKINSGAVGILENKNLCYVQSINWTKIKRSPDHAHLLQNNRDAKECKTEGLVCDPQCSTDGCWGAGPDQCLSCRNYQFIDKCIENCDVLSGIYKAGPKFCKACHQECASTCNGPGPEHCDKCKHARDGPYCVTHCPSAKYRSANGECVPCHENCVDGCLGPFNTIGSQGCNSCEKAIISLDVDKLVERCLQENESCPDGYFYEWVGPQEQGPLKPLAGKKICRKCHPRCKKCTGYGIHEQSCQECAKVKRGEQCEDECPADHFAEESTQICIPCDSECRGCTGPEASDCLKCRNFKIIFEDEPADTNVSNFNCTATCPPSLPNKVFPNEVDMEPYCSAEPSGSNSLSDTAEAPTILAGVLIFAVFVLIILGAIGYICKQKANAKKEAVKMTMVLTGCEDNEPLRPTNVKPNLAKLRIIKEAELRKGGILGFGAFGKVYKGVWVPEGERVPVKIPVAIKVLRDGSGANTSKEFMDEAYIMASVEHPNLLQLLAVCMTSQMMLITQLMPLGCLLDYVRIHREKIGSKALLNWCTQIARGMAYLEEKRLVHRDLAARNVLVQTPNCVKITDFGLAKLLNINEDEYKAAGGKMPIKWLALECIQQRIFTHKSDVWAFGVTVWELLTYGGRPYDNISARDVPKLIENGLKLSQPPICTLDIYCIMVSCWIYDPESRPTFKQLAETFAEMARDPGRYLVIPGDKFMRLPTYSHQDERELIRNISSALDDQESFIEADEYLQPKFHGGGTLASSTAVSVIPSDCQSVKPCSSTSWANQAVGPESLGSVDLSCRPQVWDKELLRYIHVPVVEGSDSRQYCNGGMMHSDGSSARYCNDTIKKDISSEDTFDSAGKLKDGQIAIMRLPLPLDEDDYLMPSPQQPQSPSGYMDLIGESQQMKSVELAQNYPDFLPRSDKCCVENPEYLLGTTDDDNNIPMQTVGLPTVTHAEEPPLSKEEAVDAKSAVPAAFSTQRSLEEESISDHEYYNDLQRELQPLRRNETTV